MSVFFKKYFTHVTSHSCLTQLPSEWCPSARKKDAQNIVRLFGALLGLAPPRSQEGASIATRSPASRGNHSPPHPPPGRPVG